MQQIEIKSREQFNELPKDKKYMLKFWASWCGPCTALANTIGELENNNPEVDFTIYTIDVDKHSDLAQMFGIRGIPTMVFFKDGESKQTSVGNQPLDVIEKIITSL